MPTWRQCKSASPRLVCGLIDLPTEITLIAVTKTVAPEVIEQAFHLGHSRFRRKPGAGSRKQIELFLPVSSLDPTLHMIGHLQSNKVKTALRLFDMIQSVDSLKLAEAIDRQADTKDTRPAGSECSRRNQ